MSKKAHRIAGHVGESLVTNEEMALLLESISPRAKFCEVGTWQGSTCRYLAENRPDANFLCVDNYSGLASPPEVLKWMANCRPNMNLFVGTFQEFALYCPNQQFNTIFIDASHKEPDCFSDLETARLLLLPGGILLAHDYEVNLPEGPHIGVVRAVDRFCLQYKKSILKKVNGTVVIG